MTPPNQDPLKEFLNQNDLTPPAAPPNEFAMITSRLHKKKFTLSWSWLSGLALAASMAVAAIFLQVPDQKYQISDEELAEFITESYTIDEDGEIVGEHFLSLVER